MLQDKKMMGRLITTLIIIALFVYLAPYYELIVFVFVFLVVGIVTLGLHELFKWINTP